MLASDECFSGYPAEDTLLLCDAFMTATSANCTERTLKLVLDLQVGPHIANAQLVCYPSASDWRKPRAANAMRSQQEHATFMMLLSKALPKAETLLVMVHVCCRLELHPLHCVKHTLSNNKEAKVHLNDQGVLWKVPLPLLLAWFE